MKSKHSTFLVNIVTFGKTDEKIDKIEPDE